MLQSATAKIRLGRLALTLALLFGAAQAVLMGHLHADTPSDPSCLICAFAAHGTVAAAAPTALAKPGLGDATPAFHVPTRPASAHTSPYASRAPPRA